MKTNTISLVFIISLLLCSCEPKELYPTHPQPNWQVENDVDMRFSMTMVGALPERLIADADTADLVAAFAISSSAPSDTLCCGITHLMALPVSSDAEVGDSDSGISSESIDSSNSGDSSDSALLRAFLYITRPAGFGEDCRILIRYYASRTHYLYQTEVSLPFQPDATIGNISDPYVLPLGEPR